MIVCSGGHSGSRRIANIKRITPTGIIVIDSINGTSETRFKNCEEIYNRADQYWSYHEHLQEQTPENLQEVIDEIMVAETARRVDKCVNNFEALTINQWRRIKAILDEGGKDA